LTKKIICVRRVAPKIEQAAFFQRLAEQNTPEQPTEDDTKAVTQAPRYMGHGPRGLTRATAWGTVLGLGAAGLGWGVYVPPPAVAMHEVDHRFTVEGHVCGTDGRPVADHEVVVKDTRASVGATVFSDSRGYYKATLHLHNDNLGDPVLVTARDEQKDTKVQFNPEDVRTERKIKVNFGTGCEVDAEGESRWVYYGAGLAGAAAAAFAGAKIIRSQRRRSQKRGKGQRKHHGS